MKRCPGERPASAAGAGLTPSRGRAFARLVRSSPSPALCTSRPAHPGLRQAPPALPSAGMATPCSRTFADFISDCISPALVATSWEMLDRVDDGGAALFLMLSLESHSFGALARLLVLPRSLPSSVVWTPRAYLQIKSELAAVTCM